MPQIVLIGGPNGAGKTTSATRLLPEFLRVNEFVNADVIASGLSAFNSGAVALEAGRHMVKRIEELAAAMKDFAFETTLASRSFAPFLTECQRNGYTVNLIYLWLASPELALERVRLRFESGGHSVPRDVILRRYEAGRRNLVNLYLPLANNWYLYDNSGNSPLLVAKREVDGRLEILHQGTYQHILR